MIIEKCEWLSESACEAILYMGDCAIFSHPCTLSEGSHYTGTLLALSVEGVTKTDSASPEAIIRLGATLRHTISAKIVNKANNIVSANSLIIELDKELPADLIAGDMIQFTCDRLDLMLIPKSGFGASKDSFLAV